MTEATIPVMIAEDAAARVAELGMQREFEQMVEHIKRTAPGLRAIRVTLEYDPACPSMEPQVVILAHRDDLSGEEALKDRAGWDWGAWQGETFPPQVFQHFLDDLGVRGPRWMVGQRDRIP
jgi:hypothetical protein